MNTPNVIAVDDDSTVLEMVRLMLEIHGYDVRVFTEPERALAHLERCWYDILITDLEMPGINGHELIRRNRAAGLHRDIPVLIMSGSGKMAREAYADPAIRVEGFLQKPFSRYELLVAANHCTTLCPA